MPERDGLQAGDRAYRAIRAAILDGEYPQGTVLAEVELAVKLGVSRTPVRAALQALLQEELLEPGPRRQVVVREISAGRRQDVFRLRLALEEVSVQEACRRLSVDQLDDLRLILFRQRRLAREGMAGQGGVTAFLELDDDFHLTIARGANIPMLERFLGELRAFVRLMGRAALARPGRVDEVLTEHEAILDALEARDEVAALQAIRAHLEITARSIDEQHAVSLPE